MRDQPARDSGELMGTSKCTIRSPAAATARARIKSSGKRRGRAKWTPCKLLHRLMGDGVARLMEKQARPLKLNPAWLFVCEARPRAREGAAGGPQRAGERARVCQRQACQPVASSVCLTHAWRPWLAPWPVGLSAVHWRRPWSAAAAAGVLAC